MFTSIRAKLLACFGFVLAVSLIAAISCILNLQEIRTTSVTRDEQGLSLRQALVVKNWVGQLFGCQADVMINDSGEAIQAYRAGQAELTKLLTKMKAEEVHGKEVAIIGELEELANAYFTTFDQVESFFKARATTPPDQLKAMYRSLDFKSDAIKSQFYTKADQLITISTKQFKASEERLQSLIRTSLTLLVSLSVLATLLGVGIAIWFSQRMSRQIKAVAHAAESIAEGSLDHELENDNQDELGAMTRSFMAMTSYLKKIAAVAEGIAAGDLSQTVTPINERDQFGTAMARMIESLRNVIGQTSTSVSVVAAAATQSSAAVTQTFATLEEMGASIQQVSQNVSHAHLVTGEAVEAAAVGRRDFEQTAEGMAQIQQAMASLSSVISGLGKSSAEIGNIIDLIDQITKQTNLLALNATIEAARAGENGRGFAVVADEVRQLAKHSATATGQISTLVTSIQQEINQAISLTQQGDHAILRGMDLSRNAAESLESIVSSVEKMRSHMDQISLASQEQSLASTQIVQATENVHQMSVDLQSQAEGLQQVVGFFKN